MSFNQIIGPNVITEKVLCPVCCRFVSAKNGNVLPHNTLITNKDCVRSKLEFILDSFDIPSKRKTDYRWLLRNLGIRNKHRLDFDITIWCIKTILKWDSLINKKGKLK